MATMPYENDYFPDERVARTSENYDHIRRIAQLGKLLNLPRLEVIKRAVLLFYDSTLAALQQGNQAEPPE